jgi:hypothetical protein
MADLFLGLVVDIFVHLCAWVRRRRKAAKG